VKFDYLTQGLWPTAKTIVRYFKKRRYAVEIEALLDASYGYRPTLIFRRKWESTVIEVRSSPSIDGPLNEFVQAALAQRAEVTIYVALPRERNGEEILLPVSFLDSLRKAGVGLLLVEDGKIVEQEKPAKCSLRFSIPTGRSLSKHKEKVTEAVRKFNRGEPVDGLRDLTEIVENSVDDLARRAATRRFLIPTLPEVETMDLEGKINLLGAPQWHGQNQHRFLEEQLKDDLKSFKGARNLGHHPRSKKKQLELETQLLERTQASIRLLREILTRTERCNRLAAPAAPKPPTTPAPPPPPESQ
jgi:hypothetical protein